MKTFNTPEENEQNNSVQGGFLILMGIIFLLGMYGVSIFGGSIWLVMGLLPFYWVAVKVYRRYQEDGYLSKRVLNMLLSCLFPFILIVAIIVGFDMSRLWPIALIIAGATSILMSRR